MKTSEPTIHLLFVLIVGILRGLNTSNVVSWFKSIDLNINFNNKWSNDFTKSVKSVYSHSVNRCQEKRLKIFQTLHKSYDYIPKLNNEYQNIDSFTYLDNGNYIASKPSAVPLCRFGGGRTKKKKILILISDTGGGHRASAQAIDQALSKLHHDQVDVSILDIWTDYAKWPFNKFVPSYRFLARHPILWRGFYAYGNFPPTKLFTEVCSQASSYSSFKKAIIQRDPDIVVSMHPLCQLMPLSIVSELNRQRPPDKPAVPFVTIVTDLGGAHSTWFDKRADYIFVPSEQVRNIALRSGIKSNKIVTHGLPIRPSFWTETLPKKTLRSRLGLCQDCKTVLLMGGGDGVGGLYEVASEIGEKLGKRDGKSELVVVCGHNGKVANRLQSKSWPKNIEVKIKGFVNNIDEYMGASDCLVTKAGPGTIAEAMVRRLPVVVSSFLPGQEAGNVPFVVNGRFGLYPGQKPHKIAECVYNLCLNDSLLKEMSDNAAKLSRPKATQDIAMDISSIVFRKHYDKQISPY